MSAPRSTYRLQFHADFDFDAASAIVDYLRDLGISHVYCSPYLQAAPHSTHGYDTVDYHRVNRELGGEAGRSRFLRKLRESGLGQVLDIVPNHMAIAGRENAWWWDTLENGTSSRYAPYFDIDWNAPEERLRNKILLPLLEDHSGRVIEAGKLKLERCGGAFVVRYGDHTFPIAPESMAPLLAQCAHRRGSRELGFLADALARLPAPSQGDWNSLMAHHRNKETIRELLERLCSEHPDLAASIDSTLQEVNGNPDELDELLLRQNYRLSRWHTAARELVYRRFFDINTLVGIHAEDERVFADTHELILQWLGDGSLDGVRVDHPDGLRDPEQYFHRLRDAAPQAWIVAEKILQEGERLPSSWEICGTTGYDFLNLAGGLFIDPHGEAPLNELYREFTGEPVDFAAVAREKKALVVREILGSDINRITALLVQICEGHRDYRDYTRHELHEAIREIVASFPVYRSYVRANAGSISAFDIEVISKAVDAARDARPDLDQRLFEFIRDILLLRERGPSERELVMRFQQITAAVMAKGVEDTAFYSYLRLVSLNEVGGNPGRFGTPVEEFHRWCREMQKCSPFTLLATSTHDTKRSEGARLRIGLLSEIPAAWADAVSRWSAANARYKTGDFPDRKTEYLLYQTLVGAWPISEQRLSEYMRKALREAKERTSWTEPNAAFEEALNGFIVSVLGDQEFLADFEQFLAPLIEPARTTSLALNLLKLAAPGIPDIYQGAELWELSLVDPDNRRPVDYDL
ncbi:MAG TPA: malto-oligosyltrehalose synthase, partial [Bryobacteraceae bacterium]|nr:malto-oligosyltrehalose synthase [Bryobacteraceae bacterium]